MGAASVVLSPEYLLTMWYWSDQKAIERSCACESGKGAEYDQEVIDM